MIPALRLELRRMRGLVGWTAVVAIAYGGIIAAFYPTFRDNQQALERYMHALPEGAVAVFGMRAASPTPGVFFNMYIGGMLWPIVAAIAAIALATRPRRRDLERGFLELPLSTRLSRVRYLGAAIAGQVVGDGRPRRGDDRRRSLVVGCFVDAPFDTGRFAPCRRPRLRVRHLDRGRRRPSCRRALDRGRAAGVAAGLVSSRCTCSTPRRRSGRSRRPRRAERVPPLPDDRHHRQGHVPDRRLRPLPRRVRRRLGRGAPRLPEARPRGVNRGPAGRAGPASTRAILRR